MIRRLASLNRRKLGNGGAVREPEFAGHCDGLVDGELQGWAWRPGEPSLRVEVEQWVDGELRARTFADVARDDLAAAGIGDGAHGWRMPLALDPGKIGPQSINLRICGGGGLDGGAFEMTYMTPSPDAAGLPADWGGCDGRDGAVVHGWCWWPAAPEEHVIVEQWVDGVLVAETIADTPRPDLEAAGIGDGRYGWSMPLRLDPDKHEPQRVELRIRGAGLMAKGRFAVNPDEIPSEASAEAAPEAETNVIGRCDGLKGSALHGWAWDPTRPDDPVEVELWVDGACVARALADGFRPDLRSNRVGTGRYGWGLPLDLRGTGTEPLQVEVRIKDGPPLDGGVLTLRNDLALDDPENAELRPFVEAVLQADAGPRAPRSVEAKLTLLAYCPSPTEAGTYWSREYDDYPATMRAFLPALARLGEVVVVESLEAAGEICRARRAVRRDCVLFAFGPPRQTPLEAPCPTVPVFAWAFPTIPTQAWDGDPRSDWRNVLRFTGRAVALSRFAAQAAAAATGGDVPIAAIPPPVTREAAPLPVPAWRRTLRLNGVVFDSRDYEFNAENSVMPTRVWSGSEAFANGRSVEIEGVLFTSVLELSDKRKAGSSLVSTFIAANADKADATLLLKLSEPGADWMPELYKWLAIQPAFACRVIAVRAPAEDGAYDALAAASHWYVTAATAEGLCLALQDFQAAGRPAISPGHTALADHVHADSALVVASDEEDWRWPMEAEDGDFSWTQHPSDVGPTTRHRISWPSMIGAFAEAHRLVVEAPEAYVRLSVAAADRARANGGAEAAAAALRALLQASPPPEAALGPSALLQELAAE